LQGGDYSSGGVEVNGLGKKLSAFLSLG
jgi:hypothetical protein